MNTKRIMLWILGGVVLAALLITYLLISEDEYAGLGRGSDTIPLTSQARAGTLPNGLPYFIMENTLPADMAYVSLIVNAGSVLERDDERGLAHFVEHLAFNGTARFPKNELIDYLRSLGMRFGAHANAYTSYDETVYLFEVPVENADGKKRIPGKALDILDDWTHAVSFKPEDVANESRVVLEEFRARLGASDRALKIMLPILFEGSPYADREPIGLTNIIANASSPQVKAFYDRWYTSDNMAIVFVGDFDGEALEAELLNRFNMPAASQPVQRPRHELPAPRSGNFHIEIITDPEFITTSFNIYYKQKQGAAMGTLAWYRESIIDNLIDTMLALRFAEMSSNPETAAAGCGGSIADMQGNSRFYTLAAEAKTGSAEGALKELLFEKEAMRRFGFTESELERAKLHTLSYVENLLAEKDRLPSASFRGEFTRYYVNGESMPGVEWEANAIQKLLRKISSKDIAKAIKKYFAANDCIVFVLAPQAEAENLPSADRIRAIFKEAENAKMSPRQDTSLSAQLLESAPAPGAIEREEIDPETGAHILSLSNGTRVILKETKNQNNEIILYAPARGGDTHAKEEAIVSVSLLPAMFEESGLGPYSSTELRNKLAGKLASIKFETSNYTRSVSGSSTTQDAETLFEMIYLFFTEPRLDERAVAAMVDRYKTALERQDDDPGSVFSREVRKLLCNNHPFFTPLELKDMDRVSVQQAEAFLRQCLNPADYTFVFVGNLDMAAMREYLKTYIASLPNAPSMNMWKDIGMPRPAAGRRTFYKGVDERSIVSLSWFAAGPDNFDEQRNQTAAMLTEYLTIILTDEIREKMGGVYGISGGASVNVIPRGEYTLGVFFPCDPARADELIAAVERHIAAIHANPLNMATFNKAREALLKGHEAALQSNSTIALGYANSSVLYNTSLNRLTLRPDMIRAVTPQAMQALCRDMLASGSVQAVLYPESWK